MKIQWRESAIKSIMDLDSWRNTIELPAIGLILIQRIEMYFKQQDFQVYLPGKNVIVKGLPVDLRMVLISIGASDPYKVFYRIVNGSIEIFLVRHPYQKQM